jgi:hypothetical protein
MKYKISKQDLDKRSHIIIDGVNDAFLKFIVDEEKENNSILSDENILDLERKTKKSIYFNIYLFGVLGLFFIILGWYQFMYTKPLIGMNLYTQFPLISNGAIEIVGGIALLIGCFYSYIKRNVVLERLVKSKLIEDLKKLQQEKNNKPIPQSKKRKRFRQSYKVGKKKS